MTLIGYARVSTKDQSLDSQIDMLRDAGVDDEFIFTDKLSSRHTNRPGWIECNRFLRRGDTLLVWRLDRLSGALGHLTELVDNLGQRGVDLRSLTEPVFDTTTAAGKLLFQVMAALNEFRVDLIRENTRAGLDTARRAGRVGGRPRTVTPHVAQAARDMRRRDVPVDAIAKALGISATSVRRALRDDALVGTADADSVGAILSEADTQ